MVKKEFKKNKKPKISESIKPESTINQKPLLSFKYYTKGNKYCLIDVIEIKKFNEKLIDFSLLSWNQITTSSGLRFKKITNARGFPKLPDGLSSDVDIFEFRVSQIVRVFGTREKSIFHLLWFDENHKICS